MRGNELMEIGHHVEPSPCQTYSHNPFDLPLPNCFLPDFLLPSHLLSDTLQPLPPCSPTYLRKRDVHSFAKLNLLKTSMPELTSRTERNGTVLARRDKSRFILLARPHADPYRLNEVWQQHLVVPGRKEFH